MFLLFVGVLRLVFVLLSCSYFVSFLVSQSSRWGRESWLLYICYHFDVMWLLLFFCLFLAVLWFILQCMIIGITHVFSCSNICRVPRMLFEHEADRPSVQHRPRDPASVNAMKQTCVIVILAYFTLFQLNSH